MIDRFEILDSNSPRPDAERIIFCDGTGGAIFQPHSDLELSHWRPNGTPAEYRAGTSTEICFRFLEGPQPGTWTAAVNNHVDVDGILSVYTLVDGAHARAHRQTLIEAAEIGDFWGWGESAAQRVFQGVTRIMNSGRQGHAVYSQAFERIPGLIEGTDAEFNQIEESLAPLRRGVELVERGGIARSLIAARLAHYIVPLALAENDERAAYVPEFNEAISDKATLWPQVRARWDAQRACLVSVERPSGWYHDLWLPGYLWADTEGLWRVPGLTYHDGMSSYDLDHPPLVAAWEELRRRETGAGKWALGGTRLPFGNELQSSFPLAGRFLDEQRRPAASRLSPEQVAGALAGVFG